MLLFACILCALCAVTAFKFGNSKKGIATVKVLWALTVATVVLISAFMIILQLWCRFEYRYVWSHISGDMELIYKISALWSGQEGSFLLWALIIAIMGLFVLPNSKNRDGRIFGFYSLICLCVFIMCFISQPFTKLDPVPLEGLGLSAALKDPWMVVHPPLVFIAYSAMAVLVSLSATVRKTDSSARIVFWLRISLIFLGSGILSGSVWAYRALGWGGYWAWDPIENAALVPWLIICGYLHRKAYNTYTVCIVPFAAACFGVFIARSGILENLSAHAYSSGNTAVSIIILCFIISALVYLVTTKIYGRKKKRQEKCAASPKTQIISYVIYGYAALIFAGTAAPILLKADTPVAFYTVISVIFVLAYSVLLLIKDLDLLKKRGLYMLFISAAFVVGIIAISRSNRFGWILLLWVCLMPFSLWLAAGFPGGLKYHLTHLGISLLIIGAVTSSALNIKAYTVAQTDSGKAVVSGFEIPLAELMNTDDALIKALPFGDIIIKRSQITALSENGYLIPYESKPLIILFWLGGFVTAAAPIFYIVSERLVSKRHL